MKLTNAQKRMVTCPTCGAAEGSDCRTVPPSKRAMEGRTARPWAGTSKRCHPDRITLAANVLFVLNQ